MVHSPSRARTALGESWACTLLGYTLVGCTLATILSACDSSSQTGSACASSGGTCVAGMVSNCVKQAPTGAQDCTSNPPTTAAGLCCLEFQEAGSPLEGGSLQDGGVGILNDSGAATSDGASDAPSADAYAGPCLISASSYDQSCSVDTDCQEVTSTNYCARNCLCGGSAINVGALAQFDEDTRKTPLGSGALPGGGACPCAVSFGPCCRSGTCTAACFSPGDTLAACADAGGSCTLMPRAGATCGRPGPPDACAYSDEVCCL